MKYCLGYVEFMLLHMLHGHIFIAADKISLWKVVLDNKNPRIKCPQDKITHVILFTGQYCMADIIYATKAISMYHLTVVEPATTKTVGFSFYRVDIVQFKHIKN